MVLEAAMDIIPVSRIKAQIMDTVEMETGRVAMVEVGTRALKANIDQKKPTTRNGSCLPRNLGSQAMKLTQTLTAAKEAGKNTKEKACPAKAQTKSTTNRAGLQVASLRTFLLKR